MEAGISHNPTGIFTHWYYILNRNLSKEKIIPSTPEKSQFFAL